MEEWDIIKRRREWRRGHTRKMGTYTEEGTYTENGMRDTHGEEETHLGTNIYVNNQQGTLFYFKINCCEILAPKKKGPKRHLPNVFSRRKHDTSLHMVLEGGDLYVGSFLCDSMRKATFYL